MKKILLIGNYKNDNQHSMLLYSAWLMKSLRDNGFDVTVIEPEVRLGKYLRQYKFVNKWLGYFDKFILFPFELLFIKQQYDLIHICDHSNAPYESWLHGRKISITCHDMLAVRKARGEFCGQKTKTMGRLLQRWVLVSLRRVDNICCVSEATHSDLVRLLKKEIKNLVTIPNVLNYCYSPIGAEEAQDRLLKEKLRIERPFFMHLGGDQWYKNKIGVLRLFFQLQRRARFEKYSLILAGRTNSEEIRSYIQKRGLAERVILLNEPSQKVIEALYCLADALLFISLFEGFGWPIIEAQACGCPVVTSNREPMKSLASNIGLQVPPTRPIEAAQQIDQSWEWLRSQPRLQPTNNSRAVREKVSLEYANYFKNIIGKDTSAN